MRLAALSLLLVVAFPATAGDPVGWGADIDTGAGPKLLEAVRGHLKKIVEAPVAEREGLAFVFAAKHGHRTIEAVKRFRNPELTDLFLALLEQDDWTVKHRALYALEKVRDRSVLPRIWELLTHETPRLREKATIACIKLWDPEHLPEAVRGDPSSAVRALLARESNPYVRACLRALLARAKGKLPLVRVYEEHVEKGQDGLLLTPFLNDMNTVSRCAPSYTKKGTLRGGGGSAAELGPAPRWTMPLLGLGEEEVSATSLQPFANLRGNGKTYHTGLDVGACLDGAGYYAAADGIVRLVHSGSDMGTLLVVQHCTSGRNVVNALYMHGGDTVFVKPGARVAAGQLLTTMGLGYSIENGGHFAHLHYGLYPGPYSDTHNYGYKSVSAGLADWFDPATFLKEWTERTRPVVDELGPVHGALSAEAGLVVSGDYGKAWKALERRAAAADLAEDVRSEITRLTDMLRRIPGRVVVRAEAQVSGGFPGHAVSLLKVHAAACKGIPGAQTLTQKARAWKKDVVFLRALKGASKIVAAEVKAEKLARKKGGAAEIVKLWEKLLAAYADTCLAPRLKDKLRLAAR